MSAPKIIRCAVYTRKSTEHNLDLEFNSLHAQREAWATSLPRNVLWLGVGEITARTSPFAGK